ncbi:hypothetical protein AAHA92_24318 [Salvia divinorum]|uniref:PB1-like domain-containing protein n=1 Tax=Salvia divinorum TaxID=28513 RepID=A0ABD1GA19_SALDI
MPPKRKRAKKGQPPPRQEVIDVDDETWDIRPSEFEFFDPYVEYADKPGMFSVALHHSGAIVKDCYVGGKLTYFDECMVGRFELLDFSYLLKLGYERSFICEFYYCDPEYNHECKGTSVGRRVRPIVDECRMDEFLSLAATEGRLMHVYVVEITAALARAKLTERI